MYLLILWVGIRFTYAASKGKEGVYAGVAFFTKYNRWMLKKICNITYEVRGPIPSEPCIVAAKHMSFLDICILGSVLPEVKFIMKDQVKYTPVVGYFAKQIGSAPVKRGKHGAAEQMMGKLEQGKAINAEGQLVVYPQGTRVLPDQYLPYKKGVWHISTQQNLPVYLAATNVGILWARRSPYRYPGHVVVEILPDRIEPGMEQAPFMKLIEDKIETRSKELMEEYPRGYQVKT